MNNIKKITFPHITAEDLTPQYKEHLEQASRRKGWKRCIVCHKGNDELGNEKLKRCPNCGHTLEGMRVYYCSRECQRQDWTDHKRYCGQQERAFGLGASGAGVCHKDIEYTRYINKMWARWTNGLRPVTAWLLMQLHQSGAYVDYRNMLVRIHYDMYPGVSSKQLRINNSGSGHKRKAHKAEGELFWGHCFAPYATSFEILPRSAFYDRYDSMLEGQEEIKPEEATVVHEYCGYAWGSTFNIGPMTLGSLASLANSLSLFNADSFRRPPRYPDGHVSNELNVRRDGNRTGGPAENTQLIANAISLRGWNCQQWPWIFSTLSLLGETSEAVAQLKLHHFLALVKPILSSEPLDAQPTQDPDKRDTLGSGVDPRTDENVRSPLSKFKAPLFPNAEIGLTKITVDPEDFLEWQSFVGSVIDY